MYLSADVPAAPTEIHRGQTELCLPRCGGVR
jgi:hypothetical protein